MADQQPSFWVKNEYGSQPSWIPVIVPSLSSMASSSELKVIVDVQASPQCDDDHEDARDTSDSVEVALVEGQGIFKNYIILRTITKSSHAFQMATFQPFV